MTAVINIFVMIKQCFFTPLQLTYPLLIVNMSDKNVANRTGKEAEANKQKQTKWVKLWIPLCFHFSSCALISLAKQPIPVIFLTDGSAADLTCSFRQKSCQRCGTHHRNYDHRGALIVQWPTVNLVFQGLQGKGVNLFWTATLKGKIKKSFKYGYKSTLLLLTILLRNYYIVESNVVQTLPLYCLRMAGQSLREVGMLVELQVLFNRPTNTSVEANCHL